MPTVVLLYEIERYEIIVHEARFMECEGMDKREADKETQRQRFCRNCSTA